MRDNNINENDNRDLENNESEQGMLFDIFTDLSQKENYGTKQLFSDLDQQSFINHNRTYKNEESFRVSELQEEINYLKSQLDEVNSYFNRLAKPLMEKAVREVAKKLRRFPSDACMFGDDFKLNFFEQICVMIEEDSYEEYNQFNLIDNAIESICQDVYDNFKSDEKFILDHQSSYYTEYQVWEIIRDDFMYYINRYRTQKIMEAYYRRHF
ncbi:MAG: hypothetical protein Q8909_19280 [Bacteroidota bacterium]|nr:hypothetical protein [Bacteroidota bacterium]